MSAGKAAARELRRLAWRSWSTIRDEALADRVRRFCEGPPPWLDPLLWRLVGVVPGLALGGLLSVVVWPRGVPTWERWAVAVVVAVYVASCLGARQHGDEVAADIGKRIPAQLVLLPYAAAGAAGVIGLLDVGLGGPATSPHAPAWPQRPNWVLALAVLLLLPAGRRLVGATVRSGRKVGGESAPLGRGSNGLRLAATWAYLVMLGFFGHEGPLAFGNGLIFVLLMVLLVQPLERCGKEWARARRRRRRAVVLPALLQPRPLAFETALLALRAQPGAWRTAVDCARYRGYPPEVYHRTWNASWHGAETTPEDARGAALCALCLWTGADPEGGLERLETVAREQSETLEVGFWGAFDQAAADGPQRAAGICLFLNHRAHLAMVDDTAWRLVRRLRWTDALAAATPVERAEMMAEVLRLQTSLASPRLLDETLTGLEVWLDEHGGEIALGAAELAQLGVEAIDAAAAPVARFEQQHLGLALRRLAYLAVLKGDQARHEWYAAAHSFEGLSLEEQAKALPPASYRQLWCLVFDVADDPEEEARQAERYHLARRYLRWREVAR